MRRKSLAFLLALVMILTLVPAGAFAATSNSVDKVPTVAQDGDFTTTLSFKVGPGNFSSATQAIKLSLENAEWEDATVTVGPTTASTIAVGFIGATHAAGSPTLISATDTTAEFEFETTANMAVNNIVELTLKLTAGDNDGEVKVKVDGLDSSVSSGTYTVAVVGAGKTTATVTGTLGSTWRGTFTGAPIEIRENAINSVNATTQVLRLTLPKGVTWGSVVGAGNMGAVATAAGPTARDLDVTLTTSVDNALRQVLVLTPTINVGKDAKMGDIDVVIRNITPAGTDKQISNASGLVIGKYVEESVDVYTVKEKDIPEFIAGRLDTDYEVEVTIEEIINSALAGGRFVEFEFPEWVQITDDGTVTPPEVSVVMTGTVATAGTSDPSMIITDESWSNATGDTTEDTSSFEFTLPSAISGTAKDKFVFTIPVTIDAEAPEGDLVVKVSGAKAGVATTELVVGKILKPVSVEVKTADLKAGVQKQALGEIIIKENFVGALQDGANLDAVLSGDLGAIIRDAKAEVVSGDIEINDLTVVGGNTMRIPVRNESVSKPSEIKIYGATVTLDRTPAEGPYKVSIGGTALVENDTHLNWTATTGGDFASNVDSIVYVNVVTPAGQGTNSTFVIGSTTFTVNGVEQTMDAAPYIDNAGRTMVPIRFIANAMGILDTQITWDQATKTATIFGEKVVSIKVGSNQIVASGTTITMDTVAVNNNGRIFVPARFVANALGAGVDWDAATQTVRIYTVK